ncbi:MAG: ATP-binding protein [Acidobacteriaceae bacterium]
MNSLITILPDDAKPVKELVVISGKGGTGKTSLVASFAALARNAVLADCDVDAADLHLLAAPHILKREPFTGGKRAGIDASLCTGCGECEDFCRFDAIHPCAPAEAARATAYRIDPLACEGCGVCAWVCSAEAIQLRPVVNGEWFISDTRFGPMVHARLGAAAENSGKLVSLVRTGARQIAEERGIGLVMIDGSPGIGCPVIASLTGADVALVVTEPTPSGLHDMERVGDLTRHFGIPTAICINKWDLNAEMSALIEAKALDRGMVLVGRVRYDRTITQAQIQGKTVVEYSEGGSAADIGLVWCKLKEMLVGSELELGAGVAKKDRPSSAKPER